MSRRIRLTFWLAMMDVIAAVGGFGSPAYHWALCKASDTTDWGESDPTPNEDPPW